ncbi:LOW QUALITY PROTEIN: hypothetical protein YC2023_005576 [Brassica napus]
MSTEAEIDQVWNQMQQGVRRMRPLVVEQQPERDMRFPKPAVVVQERCSRSSYLERMEKYWTERWVEIALAGGTSMEEIEEIRASTNYDRPVRTFEEERKARLEMLEACRRMIEREDEEDAAKKSLEEETLAAEDSDLDHVEGSLKSFCPPVEPIKLTLERRNELLNDHQMASQGTQDGETLICWDHKVEPYFERGKYAREVLLVTKRKKCAHQVFDQMAEGSIKVTRKRKRWKEIKRKKCRPRTKSIRLLSSGVKCYVMKFTEGKGNKLTHAEMTKHGALLLKVTEKWKKKKRFKYKSGAVKNMHRQTKRNTFGRLMKCCKQQMKRIKLVEKLEGLLHRCRRVLRALAKWKKWKFKQLFNKLKGTNRVRLFGNQISLLGTTELVWDSLRKNLSIECDRNHFGSLLEEQKMAKAKDGLLRVAYRRRRAKLKYRRVGCGEPLLLITTVWTRFKTRKQKARYRYRDKHKISNRWSWNLGVFSLSSSIKLKDYERYLWKCCTYKLWREVQLSFLLSTKSNYRSFNLWKKGCRRVKGGSMVLEGLSWWGIGMKDRKPEVGILAYRIGIGGCAVSSMVNGQTDLELDFNALLRGVAEMKLYWVCIKMGEEKPITSIHNQGPGENCTVIMETTYPEIAEITIRVILKGDHNKLTARKRRAEYQKQGSIFVYVGSQEMLQSICGKRRPLMAVLGTTNREGRWTLSDSTAAAKHKEERLLPPTDADPELERVIGEWPKKPFEFNRITYVREALDITPGNTLMDLKRVLRSPMLSFKQPLTTRCVAGSDGQQQTIGPVQWITCEKNKDVSELKAYGHQWLREIFWYGIRKISRLITNYRKWKRKEGCTQLKKLKQGHKAVKLLGFYLWTCFQEESTEVLKMSGYGAEEKQDAKELNIIGQKIVIEISHLKNLTYGDEDRINCDRLQRYECVWELGDWKLVPCFNLEDKVEFKGGSIDKSSISKGGKWSLTLG